MSPASFFKGIPDGKCHSAWCGPAPDSSNWLQIKVASHLRIISHLASKGSNEGHMVTSFYLAYGADGIVWENYTVGGERQVRAELSLWGSRDMWRGWLKFQRDVSSVGPSSERMTKYARKVNFVISSRLKYDPNKLVK